MNFYQHLPYQINPVALSLFSVEIRWYGLMYLAAFLTVYLLVLFRLKTERFDFTKNHIDDFFTWAIIGILLGGRLGYVLFYNLQHFIQFPLEIFLPFSWDGGFHYVGIYGMSFHGGLLGAVLAFIGFCKKYKLPLWRFGDLFVPAGPLGYMFGRIGNFINGELWGRPTNVPWGMYFPYDPTHLLRHPSQLYEALGEGLLMFCILWPMRTWPQLKHKMFFLYLILYGTVRFIIEFFRQPDEQLGVVLWGMSMGQVLCVIMIAVGAGLLILRKEREKIG
ncbi:MAG: prolipoprotein diacylglyceryl transferase [Candidatus Omnitrophica bacterium]|nr:prolipoprotein diacylglyceryl transferase [Candidatus Omnitrophota bacterium]